MTVKLVFPHQEEWDAARRAWNLAVDQHPAVVALPETADEVAEAVRYARDHGLRVAPQSTGHNAAPLGDLSDALLLKTERLRSVEVDVERRVAHVGGGAVWADVTHATAPHGLAALAGSAHDVGVAGYSLGGGISWLARKYGLAANNLEAVEIVTADGRIVRADADNEPDLFWAVRGGGGNFGVVTSLEIRLYPISEVYAGTLFFPAERLTEVLHAWREWTDDVPEEMMSVGRFMQFPPLPDIPEPLRGNSFALVEGVYIGDEETGSQLIEPLRTLGPAMDTFATIPTEQLEKLHMDPPGPVPGTGDGMMLADLPPQAIEGLGWLLEQESSLLSVEIRHLGGELGRARPENGAFASVDAAYIMFAVGIAATPEMAAAVDSEVEYVKDALAPWDAGRMYMNFAEKPRAGTVLFGGEAFHRLREVKAAYDPENVFRGNHSIAPAREQKTTPRRRTTTKAQKVLTVS